MDERLRVLYLTHHGPWPATSGGRLRDAALVPEVARLADVEVWAVSRTPELDREWASRGPSAVRVRVFSDDGPRRRYPTRSSVAVAAELRSRTRGPDTFDVVHVEGHYLFHLLPVELRDRAVVVEHNIESHLLRQRAVHRGITADLGADLEEVTEAEERVWRTAPLILTLSAEDRARILRRAPDARVQVSTNGADHLPLAPAFRRTSKGEAMKPRLGFLANYAYPPNRDALGWLLDEILPALRQRLPCVQLALAGSGLHDALSARALPSGVETLGWVSNLSQFWTAVDLAVCPLRIGGGVKVKMIEAVRSGALTVSTAVGMEGLPATVREAVVRADTAEEFVDRVTRLAADPLWRQEQRLRLARAQRALPSWESVALSVYRHWDHVNRALIGGIVVG